MIVSPPHILYRVLMEQFNADGSEKVQYLELSRLSRDRRNSLRGFSPKAPG